MTKQRANKNLYQYVFHSIPVFLNIKKAQDLIILLPKGYSKFLQFSFYRISTFYPCLESGQIFLSLPGCLCMTCVGIINETNLAQEAANYGDAGPRPQVVWANGVLASTAIGLVVDLVTGWSGRSDNVVYLMYDGNDGTVQPHQRLRFLDISARCPHYPDEQIGDPMFRAL